MRQSLQRMSLKWNREEQHVLQVLHDRHAKEPVLTRYALIAMQLENKSIRDVALRVRWKKENGNFGKGRKDDVKLAQESKDKKEATSSLFAAQPSAARPSLFVAQPPVAVSSHVAQPLAAMQSHFATQPNAFQLVPGTAKMNIDDSISYGATEGMIREQLEQNTQALGQISRNLASGQVQGSVKLFCQTRQNFVNILNELTGIDLMRQMPPLPVKLDEIPILPEIDSAPIWCGT